jgi:hypothetical protein
MSSGQTVTHVPGRTGFRPNGLTHLVFHFYVAHTARSPAASSVTQQRAQEACSGNQSLKV